MAAPADVLAFRRRRPRLAVGLVPVGVLVPAAVILGLLIAGFLAPLPYDPYEPVATDTLQGPSTEHWFGTDRNGSDVFSRTISAASTDLPLALLGTALSLLVGIPLGLVASHKGPWSERLMRSIDVFQAFPLLVLAIVIIALTGNSQRNIVFAIAIINVPRFVRLVRSEALTVRESRFVEAAIAFGASQRRVLVSHLLPNVTNTIFAQAAITAAQSIVVIAGMSFLGIGITAPTPSWGAMIQTGAPQMASGEWWPALFPGLAVLLVVLSLNELADHFSRTLNRARR